MSHKSFLKLPRKEALYWSSVCINSSQVFLGIAAVTIFTGFNNEFDYGRIIVVLVNLLLTVLCWYFGWRFAK